MALNLLRNKRNIVVDLGRPAGRDIALRLAATCDVFVTNLRPGPLARLGLGYADVAAVRPDVVYCRATGFPSDSPRAAEPAYDDIIQAASGMADTVRLVNGEPSFLPDARGRQGHRPADRPGDLRRAVPPRAHRSRARRSRSR